MAVELSFMASQRSCSCGHRGRRWICRRNNVLVTIEFTAGRRPLVCHGLQFYVGGTVESGLVGSAKSAIELPT